MGADGPELWSALRTADGSLTLVHPLHGEACHSQSGAWSQARQRYAHPCRLSERAAARDFEGDVLRLLDVGTGLGLNLAAALEALEGTGVALEALSLELDPAPIRSMLALAQSEPEGVAGAGEPWHRPLREALAAALASGASGRAAAVEADCRGVRLRLCLELGDARERLARRPRPEGYDAVFLDPFSPRRDPDLWQPAFLAEVARRMRPGSWLSTFSASLAVRAGLAAAGLRVGRGPAVGAKAAGTLASPDRDPPDFDARTARRIARRAARGPFPEARAGSRGGPVA